MRLISQQLLESHNKLLLPALLSFGLLFANCSSSSFSGGAGKAGGAKADSTGQDASADGDGAGVGGKNANGSGDAAAALPAGAKLAKDEFSAVALTGLIDIVIVVDNSNSMSDNQENLSNKMQVLLSHIQDMDWRIAIVSSDVKGKDGRVNTGDECYHALINKGDANIEKTFASAIAIGDNGDSSEQQLYTAKLALDDMCHTPDKRWLRPNSTIAVIVVSDEENGSSSGQGGTGALTSRVQFKQTLDALRPSTGAAKALVYGLVGIADVNIGNAPPIMISNTPPCSARLGSDFIELAKDTEGVTGDICLADYSPVLTKISQSIAKNSGKYVLDHEAIEGTIVVKINDKVLDKSEYKVVGNRQINLIKPLAAGETLYVSYGYMP